MQEVLGGLLPYAVTIALGPIPIIAIAIMLQTPLPRQTSALFALGWVLGMLGMAVAFTAASSFIPEGDAQHPRRWLGLVQLCIGAAILVLAYSKLRSRKPKSEEIAPPKLLASMASTTPERAVITGLMLSVVNPKHIMLVLPIGTMVIQHGLSTLQTAVAIVFFVVFASITVAGTALAYLISPAKVGRFANLAYEWMVANIAVISAIILILIGVNIIGQGIENFW